MDLYPDRYDNTNIAIVKIPVKYLLGSNYRTILTVDFNELNKYMRLKESTIKILKDKFGFQNNNTTDTHYQLKKDLENKISSGKYRTKTELAKEMGLSDSYVCRVLKYKK